jgi:hypothetical protein
MRLATGWQHHHATAGVLAVKWAKCANVRTMPRIERPPKPRASAWPTPAVARPLPAAIRASLCRRMPAERPRRERRWRQRAYMPSGLYRTLPTSTQEVAKASLRERRSSAVSASARADGYSCRPALTPSRRTDRCAASPIGKRRPSGDDRPGRGAPAREAHGAPTCLPEWRLGGRLRSR